eukprot:PhM_4_TR6300/c0_g1_i1/m.3189
MTVESLRQAYLDACCVNHPILALQTYRSSTLDAYMRFVCDLGSATSYTLVLSSMAFLGYTQDSVFLCVLLSLGLYLTNILKDTFFLPRPSSPPVAKIGESAFFNEYGMPSTHTTLAILVGYYLVMCVARLEVGAMTIFFAALLATAYVVNVAVGRMYLGMHFFGDLVTGAACAVIIIVAWIAVLESVVLWAMTSTHPLTPYIVTIFAHVLVVLHATPPDPCPCFLDSVRFLAVDVGAILGVRMLSGRMLGAPMSWGYFALRFVIGLTGVGGVKFVSGAIIDPILQKLLPFFARGCRLRRANLRTPRNPILRVVGTLFGGFVGLVLCKRLYPGTTGVGDFDAATPRSGSSSNDSNNMNGASPGPTTATTSATSVNNGSLGDAPNTSSDTAVGIIMPSPDANAAPTPQNNKSSSNQDLITTNVQQQQQSSNSGIGDNDSFPSNSAVVTVVLVDGREPTTPPSGTGRIQNRMISGGASYHHLHTAANNNINNINNSNNNINNAEVLWSLTNHMHWQEWEVVSKYVSYGLTGVAITAGMPSLFSILDI